MPRTNFHRRGWSLIELVVVVTIIGILIALLVPAVARVRESANRTECANNLAQLGKAIHNYMTLGARLPAYATGKAGEIPGGWLIPLLPYLDQQSVYDQLHSSIQTKPNSTVQILTAGAAVLPSANFPFLQCPTDPTSGSAAGQTSYLANWYVLAGGDGFYAPANRLSVISDGLSNSVFFAEAYSNCDLPRWALYSVYYHNFGVTQEGKPSDDPSYAPQDYTMFQVQPRTCDNLRTQTPHSLMQVTLGDGSVRSMARDISPTTWKELLKPNDGLPISGSW